MARVIAAVAAAAAIAFAAFAVIGDPTADDDPPSAGGTTTRPTVAAAIGETMPSTTVTTPADVVSEPIHGRRLIALTDSEVISIDLGANTVARAAHSAGPLSGGPEPPELVVTGGVVYFLANGTVFVAPVALDGAVTPVGEGLVALRSAVEGRLWVARQRAAVYVLDELDASGRTTRTSKPIPLDATPIDALGDLVLLEVHDGVTAWDPFSDRVVWTSPPGATMGAVLPPSRVAWQRPCSTPVCHLHFTDVRTGEDRAIPVGASGAFWGDGYAADPSGRYLAASTYVSGEPSMRRIDLIDTETGLIIEAPTTGEGVPAWSPDGKWLFVFAAGAPAAAVSAFRVDGHALRPVSVRPPLDLVPVARAIA